MSLLCKNPGRSVSRVGGSLRGAGSRSLVSQLSMAQVLLESTGKPRCEMCASRPNTIIT